MKAISALIRTISIILILTFVVGQVFAGGVSSNPSNNTLAASYVSDPTTNPARSNGVKSDIAGDVKPGAIGNGMLLVNLIRGVLPPKVSLTSAQNEDITMKLRSAIRLAMQLYVSHSNDFTDNDLKDIAHKTFQNLVNFNNFLSRELYPFNAPVEDPENYLIGFGIDEFKREEKAALAIDFINYLFLRYRDESRIAFLRLAQYVFHERTPEKTIIKEELGKGPEINRDDHRRIYNKIQSVIFRQAEVDALKKDIRDFITERLLLTNRSNIEGTQPPLPTTPEDRSLEAPVQAEDTISLPRYVIPTIVALEKTAGNQTRAAKLLGVTTRTMQYRIQKIRAHSSEKIRDRLVKALQGEQAGKQALKLPKFTTLTIEALEKAKGNQTRASRAIGMSLRGLLYRIETIRKIATKLHSQETLDRLDRALLRKRADRLLQQKRTKAIPIKGLVYCISDFTPGAPRQTLALTLQTDLPAAGWPNPANKWTIGAHQNAITERFGPETKIIGYTGNGNALCNKGHIVFLNNKLYYRKDEPINTIPYSILAVFKDGQCQVLDVVIRGNDRIIATILGKDVDITGILDWAISGERIVRNGQPVNWRSDNAFKGYSDPRHLFWFPYSLSDNRPQDVQRKTGRKDVFRELLWSDEGKKEIARSGQFIELPLSAFGNFGYNDVNYIRQELIKAGYETSDFHFTNEALFIRLKSGTYQHHTIGVTDKGAVKTVAITSKDREIGVTLNRLANMNIKNGLRDSIMLDQGGDVLVWEDGKMQAESLNNRDKFTSMIFLAEKPGNIDDTENRSESDFTALSEISEDLPVRAQVFKANLARILSEHPDQLFFMGIESDIGKSDPASQITPIYKAIDEIKELKDAKGNSLFPNLMVERETAEKLAEKVKGLVEEGELKLSNTFMGARQVVVDGKPQISAAYDSIKGEGKAWISAINDSRSGDYLPVFEAITLNMMAYLNADIAAIKNFYDKISDKPIDPSVLQDMIRDRIIYILPRATKFNTKQLKELYELAQQVYVAA